MDSAVSERPDSSPVTSLLNLPELLSWIVDLPETWVVKPDNASSQYNPHVHTGNILGNLAME